MKTSLSLLLGKVFIDFIQKTTSCVFAPSQLVEEDIEGDVVMVRLGDDEGVMEADVAEEQGSTFMELKPSTTLLVPLELMEGQDGLVDSSQLALHELHQSDDPRSDSHSSFSLMLDMDEEMNKDADMGPIKNDVLLSEPAVLPSAVGASDELAGKPEVILLDPDDSDAQLSGGASEEEQRRELDLFDGASGDGAVVTKVQTQITETNHESEDAVEQLDAELARFEEDRKAAELLVCETGPADDPPAVVAESVAEENALKYEVLVEEDKMTTTTEVKTTIIEQQEESEGNGPVIDTEIVSSTEMETAVGENQQDNTEVDNKEIQTETTEEGEERTDENKDVEEETPVSNNQEEEEPETEMLTSQRKKKAPSTPTRRTTRARAVTFTSPLRDEAEEPHGDGAVMESGTSTPVPASPRRTPRKSKQSKEVVQPITPRRSARKAQQEPPKEEDEERLETSKASSPARRQASQRASSARSSQRGGQEASAAADGEIQAAPDDEITDTKSSAQRGSKSPAAARRRTAQGNTPRRSSRKMLNGSEAVPAPLESLKEEKEQEEPPASPARRSTRKTKTEPPETQPAAPVDEQEKKQQVSSPSRATRQSNRNTLSVHQVCVSFLLTCKLSNLLKVPYHTELDVTNVFSQ